MSSGDCLIYFGNEKPKSWEFSLPRHELLAGMKFKAEVIDTWNMKITPVPGEFRIIADTTYPGICSAVTHDCLLQE